MPGRLLAVFSLFLACVQAVSAAPAAAEKVVIATSVGSAPFEFVDDSGQPVGMFVDLWRLWAEKTDTDIEFLPVPWGETLERMRDGSADIHAGLFYSPTREQFLDYGPELYASDTHIFFHHDILNVYSPADLAGFQVGVIEGDLAVEYLAGRFPDLALRRFPDNQSLFDAVEQGKLKVFIKDTPIALYHLGRRHLLDTFHYRKRQPLYSNMFYAGIRRGDASLRRLVREGMAKISDAERAAIEKRWLGGGQQAPDVTLIALDDDHLPYSGRNARGEAVGLLVDFWKLWGKKSGRQVDFLLLPHAEVIAAVRSGAADIGGDIRGGSAVSPLLLSPPYGRIRAALFQSGGTGSAIGYLKGWPEADLTDGFANGDASLGFSSREGMIEAGANQLLSGFISEILPAKLLMSRLYGRQPFTVAGAPLFLKLRAAVARPDLLRTVGQGLAAVTSKEKQELEARWVENPGDRHFLAAVQLALDPDEKAFLSRHPVIRIGVDPDYPPFDRLTDDGVYQGMGADYCALLARKLGVQFQVVAGLTWQQVLDGVRQGAVDMVPVITATPERRQFMAFSKPYLAYPLVIMTRKEDTAVSGLADFGARKLAVVEGYATAEKLRRKFPAITPIYVSSTVDGLLAVSTGQADGFLTDLAVALYLAAEHHITNVVPAAPAGLETPGFSMGVRQDWPQLVAILDKALAAITQEERLAVRQKWLADDETINRMEQRQLRFSVEERQWLAGHKSMRLGIDPAWPPFEYIDAAGVYQGIASDYVQYLGSRLGLTLTPLPGLSWQQVMERARKGEIDLLPCVVQSPERSRFLNFTEPYLDLPMVIVTRSDYPLVSGVTDFAAGRLAVVESYVSHDFLRRDFPNRTFYLAASIDAALQAVADGTVDGFVGNIAAISYATEKLGLTNVRVAAPTPYRFALGMAVRKDWPQLVPILNQVLAAIPASRRQEIYHAWTRVRIEKQTDWHAVWRIAAAIATIALLIVAVFLFWNRKLAREIKLRRRAELQLLKLSQAVEQSPASVVITDREGTIEYVNPYFTEVTGYSAAEAIGRNPRLLKSGRQDDAFYANLWQTILAGRIWRGDFCNCRKNGEEYWEAASIAPIVNDRNEITHFVAVKEDITQRKHMEEALSAARDAAESATRAKSDFLAHMSHEIRTPMNAVLGMTHLCLQTQLSAKQADYLQKIDLSARSLLQIINDLLDFSKIEAGKLTLEKREFFLDEVLSNVAAMTALAAQQKGLTLVFDRRPQVPDGLVGDPLRLGQILLNLINNAIKFTDSGQITVTISLLDEEERQVSLQLAIRDTGIGIPAAVQRRLFDSFTQADSSVTRRYGGTGLGLAICRRLVDLMGGRIWLESAPGEGSCFFVSAVFGRHDRIRRQRRLPQELAGLRVLVVDDNRLFQRVLTEMLESFGFLVEAAGSVPEAEQLLAQHGPEYFGLLLMDWALPDENGIAAIRRLRRQWPARLPPVILMTAYGAEITETEEVAIKTLLLKPFTASSLLDAIVNLLCDAGGQGSASLPMGSDTGTGTLRGTRMLVAEDNRINRQVARELLQSWGVVVDVVTNGRQAVKQAGRQRYDAILLDIQMPEMDGLTAAARIRKQGRDGRRVPILAMTAHAMSGDRQKSLSAGMDDHVNKPLDPDLLRQTLLRWVAGPAPSAEADAVADAGNRKEEIAGLDSRAALRRLAGNEALYRQLLAEFVQENATVVAAIGEALAVGDKQTARRLAHTVKGVSGNIGAMAVHAAAKNLEQAIVDDAPEINDNLTVFAGRLEPLLAQLRRFVGDGHGVGRPGPVEAHSVGDRARALLRLQELITAHDITAESFLGALLPQLPPSRAVVAEKVASCLERLDFDGAGEQLAELLAAEHGENRKGGEDEK